MFRQKHKKGTEEQTHNFRMLMKLQRDHQLKAWFNTSVKYLRNEVNSVPSEYEILI